MLPTVQRKPTISFPGDPYEREADEVADKAMQLTETKRAPSAVADAVLDARAAVHTAQRSGEPLPMAVRSFFEPRFGYDFSQVRVHADGEAANAAREVRARAYTIGRHIVFGEGQYQPATSEGKLLLAHELTHVVQKHGGGTEVAHRKANEPSTPPGVAAQAESSPTERLLAVITDIERVQANVRRAGDAARDEDGTPEIQAHAEKIADFLERLRAVADGDDERLKLSVLAGFSAKGVQQAEAQPPAATVVREQPPESLAAKSLEVSHPRDAEELEADRVAEAVVHGAHATVTQTTADGLVNRQAEALAAAGGAILAAEAESLPVTAWNPPGWVILGVATVVALALIGTAVYMASAQPETLSAAEEEAIKNKEAGEPYDQGTYDRARKKQVKNEKYRRERNKNKQRGGG
ncbi:eCIS core domain-containing protein [Archangium lansingense]|uniref:DUF4157 domain-containing protein n=1 Tax=Archangium lansingense TaxID=2995310 RepID=A0ABT4ABE6_9BACT|nr:DUF4157 domain-containing protein [Archangium lansinium]MCY1078896.1 DUF4157 domain-containing protein [Archangium lansinium]